MSTAHPPRSYGCTDTPSPAKEALRAQIAEQMRQFEAAGGRPRLIPMGMSAEHGQPGQWTDTLGKLSREPKAVPERPSDDEIIGRKSGSGRQRRAFRCRVCQTVDEELRVPDRHLCRSCDNVAQRAKRQRISEARRAAGSKGGRAVVISQVDEFLVSHRREFPSYSAAAEHLGVTPSAISHALRRSKRRMVCGWHVQLVTEEGSKA